MDHVDETAELVAAAGIVEKAPIAKKALPYCNIVCMTGQEMKDALSAVSYTHLDVYKRQTIYIRKKQVLKTVQRRFL